jgi:hypothetical protein
LSAIKTRSVFRRAPVATAPARQNPFPGPRPFFERESPYFRGRDIEVPELVALVRAQRFCLLYAPSGAGKSSLINAGLLHTLAARQVQPDSAPEVGAFDVIGTAKVHPSAVRGADGQWPDAIKVPNVYVTAALNSLEVTERSGHTTLQGFLDARPRYTDEFGDPVSRLMVLDQFEEILEPYGRDDWLKCRDDFFRQLDDALRDHAFHVVVVIREDHLATIERLTAQMSLQFQARYRLDRLTKAGARRAIEEPARESGLPFEPDVVDRLLAELAQRRIEESNAPIPDEFVEPAQLQVVCRSLWTKANEEQQDIAAPEAAIRASHLEAAGGAAGALRNYYDDAVTRAANGRGERELRQFIEHKLITRRGTRQLVPVDERNARLTDALKLMSDRYGIIRQERRGGTLYWELSHDGFVEPVRRANAEVAQRRRRVVWRVGTAYVLIASVVIVGIVLGFVLHDGNNTTKAPSTALEQILVPQGDPSSTTSSVQIGPRIGGGDLVVELVGPPGTGAAFELHDAGRMIVKPSKGTINATQYSLAKPGFYSVAVSMPRGYPPQGLVLNVRPGSMLVALPNVLGDNSRLAAERLKNAGMLATIRTGCAKYSPSARPAVGEVTGLLDVDRQVVPSADATLLMAGSPARLQLVPTGSNLAIEAFNGQPCPQSPGLAFTDPQSSVPQSSVPQSSVPQLSVPQSSAPESSVPQSSVPQSSVPQSSVPQSQIPQSPAPPITVPPL